MVETRQLRCQLRVKQVMRRNWTELNQLTFVEDNREWLDCPRPVGNWMHSPSFCRKRSNSVRERLFVLKTRRDEFLKVRPDEYLSVCLTTLQVTFWVCGKNPPTYEPIPSETGWEAELDGAEPADVRRGQPRVAHGRPRSRPPLLQRGEVAYYIFMYSIYIYGICVYVHIFICM